MKLPDVRWALIVEAVMGVISRAFLTIALFIVGGILVVAFAWYGLPILLIVMAILLVMMLAPFQMSWSEEEKPKHITPENRQRLIAYMHQVRKCLRRD